MKPAVFFDRDGTLNHLIERDSCWGKTSPWNMKEFKLVDGAADAVNLVRRSGFKTFIISNQPHVTLSMYNDEIAEHPDSEMTRNDLVAMNAVMQIYFEMDEIIYTFDRGSNYYKPNAGAFKELIDRHDIDVTGSYAIGDRQKDIFPGPRHLGLKTVFVGCIAPPPIGADYVVKNIFEAALLIANASGKTFWEI